MTNRIWKPWIMPLHLDKPMVLHHLNKAEEHASSGARSHSETATRTDSLGSKLSPDFPKLSNAQAIMSEAVCEAEEGASSFTTSGEDNRQADSNLDLSVAETIPQLDAEEATPYFIPWRKHLLGREEVEYLIHELSSPEGKLSENLASSHENQEEQSRNENMTTAEAPLPTSSSSVQVATDDISALLCVFRHTVEHAENNVQAFKETFDIFKECCDKMCTSMTNLQGVLETLITILRE
ncbi:uncharacterized protein LOC133364545 isoform X2 [Rhineura floridana]|uniref:uncharacterized protein LOC133364545 isoform X2 n=1 Tax=Rhineura floridana TaxID=261503 RepID=UPI002AC86DAD|nr:uncharacterized protein LOC133364545 isoform X2 [Rhineura floridana]